MALSDVSFDSGLSKHKFGNSNIRYSPDGRILSDDQTLSLPRGRSYGASRDYDDYPRNNNNGIGGGDYSHNNRNNHEDYSRNNRNNYGDYSRNENNTFEDRREKARQAFYEYHGAYPSYESQSIQRQPPAAPASSAMSFDRRDRDLNRPETHYQRNRDTPSQSRPWSGQHDTGFDQPMPSMNPLWETTRERSPVREGGYGSSQGYGTTDNSPYPAFGSRAPVAPTLPPMDHRRGLPRDPYSSYGPNNYNSKPDWHAPVLGDYHYDKTGLIAARNRNGEYGILGKWYHKRKDSPWSVLFLTVGMFLLLCGLINVLICIDYHYYCRFWAGFIILEFGILGMIHSGDWKSRWKTYSYVLLGVLSVVAAFTSTALLFEKYIPQLKQLADLGNTTAYKELQKARDDPRVNVDDDAWVWICFGFDLTTFCLFALSYLAAHASASCANRFYDFNWKCTKPCEPYGKPRYFNPFGQILLGEAMAFVGICVRYGCEVYLEDDTEWYRYWSPVWAGALTAIAGSFAAGATKRTDNTGLVLVAIFLDLLAGGAAVVAVVFCCMGLADNVEVIQDVDTLTSLKEDHLTASACLYGIAAGVCFVQVIYSVGVLASLFSFLLGKQHRHYGNRGSVRSFDSRTQTTVVSQRDRYGRFVGGGVDFPRNYWGR